MSRAQASLVVLACLLAAAWAARRVGPGLSADAPPARPSLSVAPLPAHGILAEAERLRARLASPPPFTPPSRNPFQFYEPPPPPVPIRKKTGPALSTALAEREHAERPDMQLVGIAEEQGSDGRPRRTAIVSAMMQLFYAREGERVLGRFEVVRIGAESVQLKDPDGQSFSLALR
jgi:hypothetical protein